MIKFENFGEKRDGIVSTDDERLVLIDPTIDGFFDNVLGFNTDNPDFMDFIECIQEVKKANVQPFWKPIYDPSLENGEVVFKAGNYPAVDLSFNFWKLKAEMMPTVDGKKWRVGTENQYYTFLVWLINRLIEKGWTIENSFTAVIIDSRDLGHYKNSENSKPDFEVTGSRKVCGVYDLANAFKFLTWSENDDCTLGAGGSYKEFGDTSPIANMFSIMSTNSGYSNVIGWLVLS